MEQKYEQEHELYSRALPYSLQGGSGWGEGGVGEWMFPEKVTTCDQGHQCGAAQGTSKCYRQALSRGLRQDSALKPSMQDCGMSWTN